MRAKDDVAFESQDQVLADRLDRLEPPPVEHRRELFHSRAWVRRLDVELLADERLQTACRAVDRVSFGHRGNVITASGGSGTKDGTARTGEEAGFEQQRHHVGLADRLAVEALDREA